MYAGWWTAKVFLPPGGAGGYGAWDGNDRIVRRLNCTCLASGSQVGLFAFEMILSVRARLGILLHMSSFSRGHFLSSTGRIAGSSLLAAAVPFGCAWITGVAAGARDAYAVPKGDGRGLVLASALAGSGGISKARYQGTNWRERRMSAAIQRWVAEARGLA